MYKMRIINENGVSLASKCEFYNDEDRDYGALFGRFENDLQSGYRHNDIVFFFECFTNRHDRIVQVYQVKQVKETGKLHIYQLLPDYF